jgi:hypothetical protein
VVVAGWWYVANWRDYGVALASMEILQQRGVGGLAGALAQLSPASAAKGVAVFVATLAWKGTWSLVRPPTAAIAPMVAILLLGAGAYATALRRRVTAVAWLPAWLAAWVLLAFGYHAVVRMAATGLGQPGHYLHFLAVALGVALGLGLRAGWPRAGFRWLVAGLASYALLFGVAVSWSLPRPRRGGVGPRWPAGPARAGARAWVTSPCNAISRSHSGGVVPRIMNSFRVLPVAANLR